MTTRQSRRRVLAGLTMLMLGSQAGLPAIANAQGKGGSSGSDGAGDTDRDRLREHQADGTGDRDRLMDQDRLHDMDRLRDRLHQTEDSAERERLLNRYRQQLDQAMTRLDNLPEPAANLSEAQRLRHLEQRDALMQRLMRHMWSYQTEVRGDLGG
ncbi:hypothetical protein [Spiribacter insolitus]|uniref:Uncharacterized protein n=1 Tax=Spiribacter insolitus TaxID=3122417 RepID=A0ABV3T7T5_9GAMM